jgi:Transposase DDE domain
VVEHSIGVIKRVFGFTKLRYRGLKKNAHRLFTTCALANLSIVRDRLLRAQGRSSPKRSARPPHSSQVADINSTSPACRPMHRTVKKTDLLGAILIRPSPGNREFS